MEKKNVNKKMLTKFNKNYQNPTTAMHHSLSVLFFFQLLPS